MSIKINRIIRSKRKTLALEIAPDASLIVRAPVKVSLEYIQETVFKKRLWIQAKQKEAFRKYRGSVPKEFSNGEEFLYLGERYPLAVVDKGGSAFSFDDEFILLRDYLDRARNMFIQWYKKEAYRLIKERIEFYSVSSGLRFNSFKITSARKRWGSCTSKNNLNFNWRLAMAPLEIIDYVVVHELVHITEKNHSKRFWLKVNALFPAFKKCRKWLRDNGHMMQV